MPRVEGSCTKQSLTGGRGSDAVSQVCEQLKEAMDLAMAGAMHRGGYCIVYPDSPEAKQAIGPTAQELFSQVSLN